MYKLSPDARNCEDFHSQIRAEREGISVKGRAVAFSATDQSSGVICTLDIYSSQPTWEFWFEQ